MANTFTTSADYHGIEAPFKAAIVGYVIAEELCGWRDYPSGHQTHRPGSTYRDGGGLTTGVVYKISSGEYVAGYIIDGDDKNPTISDVRYSAAAIAAAAADEMAASVAAAHRAYHDAWEAAYYAGIETADVDSRSGGEWPNYYKRNYMCDFSRLLPAGVCIKADIKTPPFKDAFNTGVRHRLEYLSQHGLG